MIDNLGGRLGSFDRLEKELAPGRALVGLRPRDRRRARSSREREPASSRRSRERPSRAGAGARSRPESPQIAERRARRPRASRLAAGFYLSGPMAKDTEKLIRQLSLISYLMAERRPVTALEIRRDVEGYSGMNEDAFARRFYADRSELESLRIQLTVERPADGAAEQENYSLRPENFHLPGDRVHRQGARGAADRAAACSTANSPTPSRCASRCSRSPGAGRARCARPSSARSRSASPRRPAATSSRRAWRRSRRRSSATRRSLFDYYTMERDEVGARARRPLPPALPGRPVLPARLRPRARGDPRLPPLADPRQGLLRDQGRARLPPPGRLRPARVRQPRRLAARRGAGRRRDPASPSASPGRSSATSAATARSRRRGATAQRGRPAVPHRATRARACIVSWVLGLGEHARLLGPPELVEELERRLELLEERHATSRPSCAATACRAAERAAAGHRRARRGRAARRRRRARRPAARPRSAPSASRAW